MHRFATIYHLKLREDPSFQCAIGEGVELRIGRDPANSVQLAHRSIAPFHCRVRNERGQLKLEPVGKPPVYVEARKIRGPLMLSGRERVRIGEIELFFAKELRDLAQKSAEPRPMPAPAAWRSRARYAAWVLLSISVHASLLLMLGRWSFGLSRERRADDAQLTTWSFRLKPPPAALPPLQPERQSELATTPILEPQSEAAIDPTEPPALDPFELWQPPATAVADGPADAADVAPGRLAAEGGGIIGVGSGGRGSGGTGRDHAGRPRVGRLGGMRATPFGRFLDGVREQGMDLVFVIDTTISMESILERAKATADRMVHLLKGMVPDLRVGVVAYRDDHDTYVTVTSPLDANLYRTLCFLHDLAATGGGDFEEAVGRALEVATRDLDWRPQARRVVLLIADAPPHAGEANEVVRRVAAFAEPPLASRGEAVVATVFAVSQDRATQENRGKIADYFRLLAHEGRGDFLELEQSDPIGRELLVLALGEKFRVELVALHEHADGLDVGARVIARHFERGDRAWFARTLARQSVEPAVVDGLIAFGDRATLELVLELLLKEGGPVESRFAALYVLKRCLKPKVGFDPLRPVALQEPAVAALREVVRRAP